MQPPRKNPGLITLIAQAFKQWFMGLSGTGKAWVVGIGLVVGIGIVSGPPEQKAETEGSKPVSKQELASKRSELGVTPARSVPLEAEVPIKRTRSQYVSEQEEIAQQEFDAVRGERPEEAAFTGGICKPANDYMQVALNDPSYKPESVGDVEEHGTVYTQMVRFRAKNGFGAYQLATWLFMIQDGQVIGVADDLDKIATMLKGIEDRDARAQAQFEKRKSRIQQDADSMVRKGFLVKD